MKLPALLSALARVLAPTFLCATAAAGTFAIAGPGGPVPDCPFSPGTWNAEPTWPTLASSITLDYPVTSLSAVKLLGFTHTWRGDVHVYLSDPAGVRHDLVVRPGFGGANSGDSGNFATGDFTIVASGGQSLAQGAGDVGTGTYDQFLNAGGGAWTSGTYAIDDAPLGSISGPAGTWTLHVVDWFATDTGDLANGWILEGTDASGFASFCEPGVDAFPCPCGNPPSTSARGCDNFGAHSGGAVLSSSGEARVTVDTLVLTSTSENASALTVFFQSDTLADSSSVAFGAGRICIAGTLLRLYSDKAVGGSISRPGAGDPSVSSRSAALGDPLVSGSTRFYTAAYRDAFAAGPCGDPAATFNASQAGSLTWGL